MAAQGRRGAEVEGPPGTLDLFGPGDGPDPGQGQEEAGTEARRSSQCDAILALLRERGQAGTTNVELNGVGYRYGARLHELRGMGHEIATTHEEKGVFRFTLRPGADRAGGEEQAPGPARNCRQPGPCAADPWRSMSQRLR